MIGRIVTALLLVGLVAGAVHVYKKWRVVPLVEDEMVPTLRHGDSVLLCKTCVPELGDLVLFTSPEESESVRRVVAGPGDTVEIKKGLVIINGSPLYGKLVGTLSLRTSFDKIRAGAKPWQLSMETSGRHTYRTVSQPLIKSTESRPIETLGDSYFVLADQRSLAHDSRDYGPVERRAIQGVLKRIVSATAREIDREGPLTDR